MPSHGRAAWAAVTAARDASADAVFRTTDHARGLAATLSPPTPTGAYFARGMRHRYSLWRVWDPSRPLFAVVGLNPSTADERENDPTVRRCVGFAEREGCGGLVMLNLFAYRATDPRDMLAARDPVGRHNDAVIDAVMARIPRTVAAWGVHGGHGGRGAELLARLPHLSCFGVTRNGHPKHPLYLAGSTPIVPIASAFSHDARGRARARVPGSVR
jgi:hypothetical protein